jgi:hypothetical protein
LIFWFFFIKKKEQLNYDEWSKLITTNYQLKTPN